MLTPNTHRLMEFGVRWAFRGLNPTHNLKSDEYLTPSNIPKNNPRSQAGTGTQPQHIAHPSLGLL